jgi:hypothetical protein
LIGRTYLPVYLNLTILPKGGYIPRKMVSYAAQFVNTQYYLSFTHTMANTNNNAQQVHTNNNNVDRDMTFFTFRIHDLSYSGESVATVWRETVVKCRVHMTM